MRDVICNTSPLQYLHQVDLLHLLPTLFGSAQAPSAVAAGLEMTGTLGVLALAKEQGIIDTIRPILDRLQDLQFRVDAGTLKTVLDMAEGPH